jgi:hypothetical protein
MRLVLVKRLRAVSLARLVAVLVVGVLAVLAGGVSASSAARAPSAFVPADLLAQAQARPDAAFAVILQGSLGHAAAAVAADVRAETQTDPGLALGLKRQLATIDGAAAQLTGKQLLKLARMPGITAITPDLPVRLSGGISSTQQWPFVSGVARGWANVSNGSLAPLPAIAVVDSGIEAGRADFSGGARVLKQVTLTNLPGNSPGDGYGHGTFVAGIAAGSASSYSGAAPSAPIVSLDVMDDQGMALTSDVIAACDWIVQNKSLYNIRVANFSLHSTAPASLFWDPLDRAVEKLWFDGVVVVTASGNYGVNGQPSGVLFAPGNDPFVITVGADDVDGSVSTNNDTAAPWSSYGYTYDGFAKPELGAPGRYMIGPVPPTSHRRLRRLRHRDPQIAARETIFTPIPPTTRSSCRCRMCACRNRRAGDDGRSEGTDSADELGCTWMHSRNRSQGAAVRAVARCPRRRSMVESGPRCRAPSPSSEQRPAREELR